MKKFLIFLTAFSINACASQLDRDTTNLLSGCELSFEGVENCSFKSDKHDFKVVINAKQVADDEKLLTSINITANGVRHELAITPNTSMLSGDSGQIFFDDINFDQVPDLALTTSFGTPNLYLDYWVFQPDTNSFKYVGNYPKFTVHVPSKTLSATIKNNAESYVTKKWYWANGELKTQR